MILASQPTREFGKRGPVAIPAPEPVKRSRHVALLLMGTFAVGGAAYALMPGENCWLRPGLASDQQAGTRCPARGYSSGGSSWSSRQSFFGSDAKSGQSAAASSDAASGSVKRGGFGGFAQAFASHFSGGG